MNINKPNAPKRRRPTKRKKLSPRERALLNSPERITVSELEEIANPFQDYGRPSYFWRRYHV